MTNSFLPMPTGPTHYIDIDERVMAERHLEYCTRIADSYPRSNAEEGKPK